MLVQKILACQNGVASRSFQPGLTMWCLNFITDMKQRNKPTDSREDNGLLGKICLSNDRLKPYFESGLGAMERGDKKYIKVPYTKLLSGSLALDEAAKETYPNSN